MPYDQPQVTLSWRNLSYAVTSGFWTTKTTEILHNLSGSVRSGQVLALLGSSGSGKTVLLDCLSGRRSVGVSGTMTITSSIDGPVKFASVPQTAAVYGNLTVRESVLFSSRIRNQSASDHVEKANKLLSSLKLSPAADTPVSKCSGGQQKRVTLAVEMVSEPQILLLDEVTSGLDSRICYDLLKLLKQIAQEKAIAVIIAIHQPTWPSFLLFDHILLLSSGRAFYYREPLLVEAFLTDIGVQVPEEQNPADILMEASCNCYGIDVFASGLKLTAASPHEAEETGVQVEKSIRSTNSVTTFFLLMLRMTLVFSRNIPLVLMMLFSYTSIALVAYLVLEESGDVDPCLSRLPENGSLLDAVLRENDKVIGINLNIQAFGIMVNTGGLLGGTMLLITIPTQLKYCRMEVSNNWYHPLMMYSAIAVFDAVLFSLTFLPLSSLPFYYLMQENTEFDRTMMAISTSLIDVIFVQAFVSLIAAILSDHITSSISLLMSSTNLFFSMSATTVKFSKLSQAGFTTSFLSHNHHSVEMMIISQYGFDRCGDQQQLQNQLLDTRNFVTDFVRTIRNQVTEVMRMNPAQKSHMVVDEVDTTSLEAIADTISRTMTALYISPMGRIDSYPMVLIDGEDNDFWKGLGFLLAMMFLTRIIAGIIFVKKSKAE